MVTQSGLSRADRAQAAVVRGLYAMPPGLVRRLAGRPLMRDGLTLDPEAQLALRLLSLDPRPSFETLPVEEARAAVRHEAKMFAGPTIPLDLVETVSVAGADGPLEARRYVPPGYRPPGPAVVFFHGGGWVVGDLDTHDQSCRFLARHSTVQVVAIDYRLAPEHPFPAAADDAVAAFRDVVRRAGGWGIDPTRVGVAGDSAGGHLSAAVCLQSVSREGPRPAFQLLIYPATDATRETRSYGLFSAGFFLTLRQMRWYYDHFLPPDVDRANPLVSPLLADRDWLAELPPAYVATAGFDPLRDEGEAFAATLAEAGVAVTVRRHPGLIHGFANLVGFGRAGRLAMAEAAGALAVGLAAGRTT